MPDDYPASCMADEQEQIILGGCIVADTSDHMTGEPHSLIPANFRGRVYQEIARSILDLHSEAVPLNLSNLSEWHKRNHTQATPEDITALMCAAYIPTPKEQAYCRKRILEAYAYRLARQTHRTIGAMLDQGHPLDVIADTYKEFQAQLASATGTAGANGPWSTPEDMAAFLTPDESETKALYERMLYPETITEIFSPRGLGKTLFAYFVAVTLAKRGVRVLLLDRDNPRRIVRDRLRAFGVDPELGNLKVFTRDKCPPLTHPEKWKQFPYADYDVVIFDSFDSMAEGVGEQDSAKPSRAIATILDIGRRENGPAILVLGNCVRNGAHSRGSGVVEDRADIVFEVRDATNFTPTGNKPWVEELQPADAGSWVNRSSRRKRQTKYRLAFIATKFRGDEEPEPFIVEIDLSREPWSVSDVTDLVDQAGKAERDRRSQEKAQKMADADQALYAEITRRNVAGEAPMLKEKDATPFLISQGLPRIMAREIINSRTARWSLTPLKDHKGHPITLMVGCKSELDGGNTTLLKGANSLPLTDADFRRPLPMHTAEIDPLQTRIISGSQEHAISAVDSLYSGGSVQSTGSEPDPDEFEGVGL